VRRNEHPFRTGRMCSTQFLQLFDKWIHAATLSSGLGGGSGSDTRILAGALVPDHAHARRSGLQLGRQPMVRFRQWAVKEFHRSRIWLCALRSAGDLSCGISRRGSLEGRALPYEWDFIS
jgi:hypothetical protein